MAEILGLEEVDQIRLDLQRARNELKTKNTAANSALSSAKAALQLASPSDNEPYSKIVSLCEKAGITVPKTLEDALGPTWTETLDVSNREQRDLSLGRLAADLGSCEVPSDPGAIVETWNSVLDDDSSVIALRLRLMRAGHSYLASHLAAATCPLCNSPIRHGELTENILQTIEIGSSE